MTLSRFSLYLFAAATCFLAISADEAAAQRRPGDRAQGGGADRGDQFLQQAGLKVGDKLPDVSGYDINGKPFALRDIEGSYAVLVSGCMT